MESMKIIVGCKLVPEEQDISVQADGTLDTSKATPKISQFDLNAVEAAVGLKSTAENCQITALSVGGKELEIPRRARIFCHVASTNWRLLSVMSSKAFCLTAQRKLWPRQRRRSVLT